MELPPIDLDDMKRLLGDKEIVICQLLKAADASDRRIKDLEAQVSILTPSTTERLNP